MNRPATLRAAWPALLAAGLLLPACTPAEPKGQRLTVFRTLIDDPFTATTPGLDIDRATIETELQAAIEASPYLKILRDGPAPGEVHHLLRLDVKDLSARGKGSGSARGRVARLAIELRLSPLDATKGAGFTVAGQVHNFDEDPTGAKRVAFRPLLQNTLREVFTKLGQQIELSRAAPAEIIAALGHTDQQMRFYAIQQVRERRIDGASKPLLELAASPDTQLSEAAMGALTTLRVEEAVPEILRLTDLNDTQKLVRTLHLVHDIGGHTAKGFLFTIAEGFRDEAVAATAQRLLDDLEAPNIRENPNPAAVAANQPPAPLPGETPTPGTGDGRPR